MLQMHKHRHYAALSFAAILVLQWLHFTLYFKQPAGISFIWSLVDWTVWFTLFWGYIHLANINHKYSLSGTAILFVLFAGVLQVVLSSLVYYIIFDADKSLITSITQSLNKRWLQNLMISGIMVLLHAAFRKPNHANQSLEKQQNNTVNELCLYDGKHYHRVLNSDIFAVLANKNYLSVFTRDQEIVIRSTLKAFVTDLNDPSFIQISRSAIVNAKSIDGLFKYSRTSYKVKMLNDQEFNVSKAYLGKIKSLFN